MVKIYDNGELPFRKARNFNMLAFKYKPFVNQLIEEIKTKKIKVDKIKWSSVISELITEYSKNRNISFEEMLKNIEEDHVELKDFIDHNYETIKNFWLTSDTVKSLKSIINS